MTLTDKLIHRIERTEEPDRLHLLFLDKSARPVAWFVRALWPLLARQHGTSYGDGNVPPLPPMSFANIDREQWWDKTGASETGAIDVNRVPTSDLASFRAAFLCDEPASMQAVWDQPAMLDGRKILVIDEVSVTGDTLRIAEGLVGGAFPSADVLTGHWMTPGNKRDVSSGQSRVADVPVWYRSDSVEGRLVGNRLAAEHRGTHWRGRRGMLFLSTVPPRPDIRGIRLKLEIARIAADVGSGRLLAAPSSSRDIDDILERINTLYGFDDPREFTSARLAQ